MGESYGRKKAQWVGVRNCWVHISTLPFAAVGSVSAAWSLVFLLENGDSNRVGADLF